MRKSALFALLTAFALVGAATTHAHHAVQAQFDVTKNLILSGTLKKVDWTNPHAWFHFDVKGQDGALTVWSLETVGPNGFCRRVRPPTRPRDHCGRKHT